MNVPNIFKLYYVGWHQEHETREYSEFGDLKKNLAVYKNILIKSDIEEYISNFTHTMYLDLWVDVCKNKKEYFRAKVKENIKDMVEDASNILYYLSSQNIETYYTYIGADYVYNSEEQKEPSETKKMKTLLLIAKKIDSKLYSDIIKMISQKLTARSKNISVIKDLWNTIEIDSEGKVHATSQSYLKLQQVLNTPDVLKENEDEINEFYNMILYSTANEGTLALQR